MKFLKIGLSVAGVFFLLLVIGGIIFVATFDANQYKSLISEQVKQQTGRDLSLQNITPSIFPWLGVELQQISLSNAQGFSAANMLKIQRLDVRLQLIPLLSQNIHVDTLKLHGLELFLEKNKQGVTNWDDIVRKQASQSSTSTQKNNINPTQQKTTDDNLLAGLVINGVEIKAANINWNDASSGKNGALKNIDIATGVLKSGEVMPIKISTKIALAEPAMQLDLNMRTKLKLDLSAQQVSFSDFVLALKANMPTPELQQIQIKWQSALNINLNTQRIKIDQYTLDIQVQGDAFENKTLQANIEGSINVDLKKQTARIKPLKLKSSALEINMPMDIKQLFDKPSVNGQFKMNAFNPRRLAKSLGIDLPPTRNPDVLKTAAIKMDFTANEQNLTLSSLILNVDQSKITAQVNLRGLQHKSGPQIQYSATLNQLVLDDYLAPPPLSKKTQQTQQANKVKRKKDIPIELPLDMLQLLKLNGFFHAVSLTVSEQNVSNLKMNVQAKAGVIKLSKVSATLLNGNLNASAQLDVREKLPRYQFKLQGKQLQAASIINPMLQDILGEKSVSITGRSNINVNVNTQGTSLNQLIKNSNGNVKLAMGKAQLQGVDAEYFVRKGVVDFLEDKKQPVPNDWRGEYKPKDTTAIKIARASATIKQGVINNKDLLLDASRFKITGAGNIDLPREQLNYRVVVDVQPSKTKTAGERLLDVPMPIFVTGSFAQPAIKIDSKVWLKLVGKELKSEVKKEIKQKIKKQKDKKIDKLKKKYKDKLKNLFR